ncbi:MAG: response regulator [Acidobacteria bacterium]|uniref:Response regulator n=1 Tax=Candidatus Polarisedimenticola svalbardensis TaxID=2886004 RepID=A0A8J7C332_9BACT|nr:response regulator [Candidatus Polarisedimenticola svalbardensis]
MSNENGNENGRRFFTTSEIARYCAVTNDGVLKWIKSSKLRAFSTPGGHYRISAEDFRAFLERFDMPVDESFFRGSRKERTVLVVDDERDIRDIVRRLLEELDVDLKIEEAQDGYEAGIKIGNLQPDLVIMDLMMPKVDGFQLCRSIRENDETRGVKVLAITAFPEQDNVKKMYDAGADLCLIKPLQLEHFKLEVMRLLNEATRDRAAS